MALCAVSPGRAHAVGLTITPTFDSSITSDPNAAAIEGAINAAIGVVASDISTPMNVTIYFQELPFGDPALGRNTTADGPLHYYDYYNALKAIDTAPGALMRRTNRVCFLGGGSIGANLGQSR